MRRKTISLVVSLMTMAALVWQVPARTETVLTGIRIGSPPSPNQNSYLRPLAVDENKQRWIFSLRRLFSSLGTALGKAIRGDKTNISTPQSVFGTFIIGESRGFSYGFPTVS